MSYKEVSEIKMHASILILMRKYSGLEIQIQNRMAQIYFHILVQ